MPGFAIPTVNIRYNLNIYYKVGEIYLYLPLFATIVTSDVSVLNKMLTSKSKLTFMSDVDTNLLFFILQENGYLCIRPANYDPSNHTRLYNEGYAKIQNLETTIMFARLLKETYKFTR